MTQAWGMAKAVRKQWSHGPARHELPAEQVHWDITDFSIFQYKIFTPRNKETEDCRNMKTKYSGDLCNVETLTLCGNKEWESDFMPRYMYGIDETSIGILQTVLMSSTKSQLTN